MKENLLNIFTNGKFFIYSKGGRVGRNIYVRIINEVYDYEYTHDISYLLTEFKQQISRLVTTQILPLLIRQVVIYMSSRLNLQNKSISLQVIQ